nr:hypothetical protein [Amycolatopsis panacis]
MPRSATGLQSGVLPAQDAGVTAAALVGAGAEVLVGPLTEGGPVEVVELRTVVVRSLGGSDACDA